MLRCAKIDWHRSLAHAGGAASRRHAPRACASRRRRCANDLWHNVFAEARRPIRVRQRSDLTLAHGRRRGHGHRCLAVDGPEHSAPPACHSLCQHRLAQIPGTGFRSARNAARWRAGPLEPNARHGRDVPTSIGTDLWHSLPTRPNAVARVPAHNREPLPWRRSSARARHRAEGLFVWSPRRDRHTVDAQEAATRSVRTGHIGLVSHYLGMVHGLVHGMVHTPSADGPRDGPHRDGMVPTITTSRRRRRHGIPAPAPTATRPRGDRAGVDGRVGPQPRAHDDHRQGSVDPRHQPYQGVRPCQAGRLSDQARPGGPPLPRTNASPHQPADRGPPGRVGHADRVGTGHHAYPDA